MLRCSRYIFRSVVIMPELRFLHTATANFPDTTRDMVTALVTSLDDTIPPDEEPFSFNYSREKDKPLLKVKAQGSSYLIQEHEPPLSIEPSDGLYSGPLLHMADILLKQGTLWCLELSSDRLSQDTEGLHRIFSGSLELTRSGAIISVLSRESGAEV